MSVEQALAARTLIAEQAKNQLAKMEHIASLDPEAVDPDILAEQIALAERAAVLNRRAMAKQKLAEQNSRHRAPGQSTNSGPATAGNLAMVTPLEFVQVPGVDRPVMKPPATSYVPVRPARTARAGVPNTVRQPARPAVLRPAGRPRVIARAEAAARAATEPAKPAARGRPGGESDDLFADLPRPWPGPPMAWSRWTRPRQGWPAPTGSGSSSSSSWPSGSWPSFPASS